MTITTTEYALLSANVYGNSGDVRKPRNTLPIPDGWTALSIRPTDTLASGSTDTGFMAKAYMKGNDIVVSYAGTTDEDGLDWLTGNLPAATGVALAPQLLEAARFYLDVRAANPNANITFAGHSLGGGLASLMAVYFNRHATVFDEAPFQKSADSAFVTGRLISQLTSLGYGIPVELRDYLVVDPSGALIASPSRRFRQGNVDQIFTTGEVLSVASTAMTNYAAVALGAVSPALWSAGFGVDKIVGTSTPIDPKARTTLGWGFDSVSQVAGNPVDLHSITLLTGFLLSPAFLATVQSHPELLPRLFAGLFENNPKSNTANLTDLLVQREYRGEGSLGALSVDVDKIDLSNGLTSVTQLPNGGSVTKINVASVLVDAVLASLYKQGKDRAPGQPNVGQFQTLLKQVTGGLQVDASVLGEKAAVVETELRQLLDAILGADARTIPVDSGSRWTTQIGASPLNVAQTADARADVLLGYTGADSIDGGAGDDVLVGYGGNDSLSGGAGIDFLSAGDGNDLLDGGDSADWLSGGAGTDTYRFTATFGADIIQDSDAQGNVVVTGLGTLNGSNTKKSSSNAWQSADKSISYALVSIDATRSDLLISFADRRGSITIRNWSNGQLGITLPDAITPPVTDQTIADTGGNDYLSAAADVSTSLLAQTGNDALNGSSADDLLEGGLGDDVLAGGAGRDTLNGGDGNDYLFGAAWAASSTRWDAALMGWTVSNGSTWSIPGIGSDDPSDPGNVIDGGAGNDWVAAGGGNDIVQGGAGADLVYAMAGDDFVAGGEGSDQLHGDSSNSVAGNYNTTDPAANGNDLLVGGAGNDSVYGEGGDDELYGGADDDLLMGDTSSPNVPAQYHGNDYLDGGDGNDSLIGGGKDDDLYGGAGNDTLSGDDSALVVAGEAHGADYLDGEDGDDQLTGDGGADTLHGGAGNDKLIGDSASDTPAQQLAAQFQGADYLDGEDGNDTLYGTGGADTLFGGAGNDTLQGDDQMSRLAGSAHGADYLDGEDGDDRLTGNGGDNHEEGRLWGDGEIIDTPASSKGDESLDCGALPPGGSQLGGGSRWPLLHTHEIREALVRTSSGQAANSQRFVVAA